MKPVVSIIYVYYNTPRELLQSVDSVLKTSFDIRLEIIIVDNNSEKAVPPRVKRFKKVRVISNSENLGFGKGCNIGAKVAKGRYLLFLNPDTQVYPNAISELLATIKKKRVGVVGPKMLDKKGKTLPTISRFVSFPQLLVIYSFLNNLFKGNSISKEFWLYEVDRGLEQRVDVLSGACLLISKKIFNRVGGFDERFFMYFEEHDLCKRIRETNLECVFNPNAKIIHHIGKSLSDKEKIRRYFEKSRFQYVEKHFGFWKAVISEGVLRFVSPYNLFAILLFFVSVFINTFKQKELMLFIGDAARDFLVARDMILSSSVPIVGIPSSVPWLHQGPISIYGIAFAFFISRFNPIAPGTFFGIIGALTTIILFILVRKNFGEREAVIASSLYAVSPMVVVNARMPYHTSLIPFFTVVFFFLFMKSLKNIRYVPLVFFSFGLLLQVELSNIVVGGIIAAIYYIYRIKLGEKIIISSIFGFFMGILPFVLYDIIYGPAYIKFPLWIINRIRLFFGLTFHHSSTVVASPNALMTIYQQISGVILPHVHVVALFIFLLSFFFLLLGKRNTIAKKNYVVLLLWLMVPLSSFVLHASPGTAYFGLIYPAIIITVALLFNALISTSKFFIWIFIIVILLNVSILFRNDFFVTSKSGAHPMPPLFYNFGTSWKINDEIAAAIVKDADGRPFELIGKEGLALFKTSIDPYVYLTWYHGGNPTNGAKLRYYIYQQGGKIGNSQNVIFSGEGGVVEKNE